MTNDSLNKDVVKLTELVFCPCQVATYSARVHSGRQKNERHWYATDQGKLGVYDVEDVEREEELHSMPEYLSHSLGVEQVYSPHVTGHAAYDLARHHFVEVAEGLVYESIIEVPSHNAQYVLGESGAQSDVNHVEDPPYHSQSHDETAEDEEETSGVLDSRPVLQQLKEPVGSVRDWDDDVVNYEHDDEG